MKPKKISKRENQEIIENNNKIESFCQKFSKLNFEIKSSFDLSDGMETMPCTPRENVIINLNSKYLSKYRSEYEHNFIQKTKNPIIFLIDLRFDNRALFYNRLLQVFCSLKLKNKTIFRAISLLENVLHHPKSTDFHTLIQEQNKNENIFFQLWFEKYAVPCTLIACDQEESNFQNWGLKMSDICKLKNLPFPQNPDLLKLEMFMEDKIDFLKPIYTDFFDYEFSKKVESSFDLEVVKHMSEQLVIQQIVYDYEVLIHSNPESVMRAAVKLFFERLKEYVYSLDENCLQNEGIKAKFRNLKSEMPNFLKSSLKIVEGLAYHFNDNISDINDGFDSYRENIDEEIWNYTSIRDLLIEFDFF